MHTAIGILSIVAAGFFALLVHEAGHLAAGLSAGFRFQMLTVGLMTIVRELPSGMTAFVREQLAGVR